MLEKNQIRSGSGNNRVVQTNTELSEVEALATEVLKLAKNSLIVALRYMDSALAQFRLAPEDKVKSTATDGQWYFYNPVYILRQYKADKNAVMRTFLHSVLHCVFSHPFIPGLVNKECYDLAADIAVEHVISELGIAGLPDDKRIKQAKNFVGLKHNLHALTAEKIYRFLIDEKITPEQSGELAKSFHSDDHFLWWNIAVEDRFAAQQAEGEIDVELEQPPSKRPPGPGEQEQEDEEAEAFYFDQSEGQSAGKTGEEESSLENLKIAQADLAEAWDAISEQLKVKLELKTDNLGEVPGALTQNIAAVTREKHDYAKFLKRFSVLGESMEINEDEFDYILYTYGLKLYNRMPLIEPLEYKESLKIRDFVIAIDTSGSVSGETVQAFLQKTYNILSQGQNFFEKVNIRILQCDMRIQTDVKIENKKDFDDYLKDMKLFGFGGTDFRPVFEYVDKLIADKQFKKLKGLIYFTDGMGVYPQTRPNYETAFVFLTDDYAERQVPPWAMKVVLSSEEVMMRRTAKR